ncbi:MAG: cytochrome-c oxidase, cbb3-type subunit II [Roseitalea porphyridii]|uniref:Cytochrome-c oxidase, cbb3-type subunit II n=1 Tax=Roseitalea porphyridii TaxID=1852022 RepID=A0A4P6V7N6_9HYPH|nr:cytochrome-c oxidase, cbb3-type subunit II [Roseitalea porphyridii]QBK32380.1 cytochrome-c oxidase, cbb3-type subunit II [Roseitalea porphyridii]
MAGALPEVKADPVAKGVLGKHAILEKNATLLLAASLVVVSIGGIVEIAPLFYLENTIEEVEGMRPYSPLELAGRNIYIREGCYVCHSQMIRPFRDEVERYGHYSLAAESMYDHPFQWGSKRTGPDLARVGGRYSNEWQVQHLIDPQSVVPESIMPSYEFLINTDLEIENVSGHLIANRRVGVPYTDEMIDNARADLEAQADPDADWSGIEERYPKAVTGDFDGNPDRLTEMDALVAYLQMLGTLVDFSVYQPEENFR